MISIQRFIDLMQKVREQKPLLHVITNRVAINDSANGALAVGASPIMAEAHEEVESIASISGALELNIGNLTPYSIKSMLLSGHAANQAGVPVVLDPVGAGATDFRLQTVQKLLTELDIAIIRGNAGEIAALAGEKWGAKGVDAGEGDGDLLAIAERVASKWSTVVAVSGAVDTITDGQQTYCIQNGHPLFPYMTGSGCLNGVIQAAYAAVSSDYLEASVAASINYAIAGQLAGEKCVGPGSFRQQLMDELYLLNEDKILHYAAFEEVMHS
ncbi:hydroxyethylthiazole kinase [Sporolactobacillus sp. STSJ-5]|uniref:hydroxyethylthiazole kinase n=1 Tax=Sporolactobacillus sp. STSJ-5 TaxID=2965076 RepID=UPI002105BCAD|nr:hydroxyethylthiazole kinase [Sporolactobacillus sp. STSJ-5]MCQ2008381.1 hydroxyethylthiazole kinase [Sporolactobacillus sp. STSJ-5]